MLKLQASGLKGLKKQAQGNVYEVVVLALNDWGMPRWGVSCLSGIMTSLKNRFEAVYANNAKTSEKYHKPLGLWFSKEEPCTNKLMDSIVGLTKIEVTHLDLEEEDIFIMI